MRCALLLSALFGVILCFQFNPFKYIKNECKLLPPGDKLNRELQKKVNQARRRTNATRLKYFCQLSKMLRVAMDYKLPGITILHQKLDKRKDKVSQLWKGKKEKIPKHPPVSVGPIQQIPFGCIWGKKEASCIFMTGKFFKFLRRFVDFVDSPLTPVAPTEPEISNEVEELPNVVEISPTIIPVAPKDSVSNSVGELSDDVEMAPNISEPLTNDLHRR